MAYLEKTSFLCKLALDHYIQQKRLDNVIMLTIKKNTTINYQLSIRSHKKVKLLIVGIKMG